MITNFKIPHTQTFKLIAKLIGLCCLFTIASCQQECKPRSSHNHEADFVLKKVSKYLNKKDKNIIFSVQKRKNSTAILNDNLFLRLTRREGQSAKIKTATGVLPEISPGLFEFKINKLDEDILNLFIEIVEEKEQRAVFELELVYNAQYQGKPKKVTWENKDINLSIKELPTKLYDHGTGLRFKIQNKGKDAPEENSIVLTFTRKDGHKAIIEGSPNFKSNQEAGVFELPITLKDFEETNTELRVKVVPGETKATFDVQLAYKGTKIGKSKTITWMAKKVNLSLKNLTQELRGDKKQIEFSMKLKGHKLDELDDNLVLRVTKMLDTNASVIRIQEDGEANQTDKAKSNIKANKDKKNIEIDEAGKVRNFFEFPITKEELRSYLETKAPIKTLEVQVEEGDTKAQFKLQLVYNKMNVGKAKLVTWRAADVNLKLIQLNKKLVGEGDGQIIKFAIRNKGQNKPKDGKTMLRLVRHSNTNATLELATSESASATTAGKTLEVGPGIFEISLTNYEIESAIIDKLRIKTAKGDKKAEFSLQLFYDGMEMGKPKNITWKSKDINLKLTEVPKRLVGDEDTDIPFKISKKGSHDIDEDKPFILRFTRQEGFNAKITGIVQNKGIQDKGHGVFELDLVHTNIGNRLEGLKLEHRPGEIKAKFELQLIYDGMAISKPHALVWEAETVQLDIQDLTEKLRGDLTDIKFTIKNKGKGKPEKDALFLRLTRKEGYNSEIKHANSKESKLKDKGDGLYELKISINDIEKEISGLYIDTRIGETRAEFRLQLVYDGIDVGNAKTLIWEEKDIKLELTKVTSKLGGEDDKIKFTVHSKGKDKPEKDKLYVRFVRIEGHEAKIVKIATKEGTTEIKNQKYNKEETGKGVFEFLLDSDNLGNEIAEFMLVPREGERKAEFTMQLVYNTIEIGKPKTITWVQKAIALYITELSDQLRGYEEESTSISFKIGRDAKHDQEKNRLEEGKLSVRFTRKKGRSSIKTKGNSTVVQINQKSGIFEYNIDSTQRGNLIKDFFIELAELEKAAEFKIELVYDGKKIGGKQTIQWTRKDIKLDLILTKSQIGGDLKQEYQKSDNILGFTIKSKGKDQPEQGNLILRIKRNQGMNVDIEPVDQSGIVAGRFRSNSKEGYFDYELDVKKLGVPVNDLMVPVLTGARKASFTLQLIYEDVAISKPKSVVWENMILTREEEKSKRAEKEAAKQKREAEKQEKKTLKENEKAEKEKEKVKIGE